MEIIEQYFTSFLIGWIILAVVLIPIQLLVAAPYGRHTSEKWGPLIDNRIGWIAMELVSLAIISYFFIRYFDSIGLVNKFFLLIWIAHYINRSIIYPFRISTQGKKMPLIISLFAMIFNSINAFANGYYLTVISPDYGLSYLGSPFFIIGLGLLFIGVWINLRSDNILLSLRSKKNKGYQIPNGFLFEKVSCPNHFGEILEWTGFAIMTWNLPAAAFAIWTMSNLIPRAYHHHQWYKKTFPSYPKSRKIIIPNLI